MINESYYWKKPLLESAKKFKAYQSLERINEEVYVDIEKSIFIGFYSIRKLLESATKVTDELKNEKYDLIFFPHIGNSVTWLNNHQICEIYNLEKSLPEKRNLWFIASRIIHSFIFNLCTDQSGGFDGILFTSDIDKDKKLYMLSLDQLVKIFEDVGNNYVSEIKYTKCPETGNEITTNM